MQNSSIDNFFLVESPNLLLAFLQIWSEAADLKADF